MLAKSGIQPELFEAGSRVGGLAKTVELWNQRVDLGPHRFFSCDERVNGLWSEIVGEDYVTVQRLSRILYKNKLFYYPLKPFDALLKLGPLEAFLSFADYMKGRIKPIEQDGTFEAWVVNRFGRRLFDVFFKTYSEKLWGISCRQLDADFAAQRIKKLSLYEAVKSAFLGDKRNHHKTLVDEFAYPSQGTGVVYERMAALIQQKGGRIHYRTPVQRVLTDNHRVIGIELKDGTLEYFDYVISSMPISLLVSQLPEAPDTIKRLASLLKFRNTNLVYLNVQATGLFPDNWIYVHAPDLKVGRITNFRNWSPHLYGDESSTILALEYWCDDQDTIWRAPDDTIIDLAKRELVQTKLTNNADILAGHVHKIHRCYPVYNRGYKQTLKPIENYLDSIEGLRAIGRYGAFKYNNQDHSILMGIMAAEDIINNQNHNLWEINTDYETYQEAARISTTSLDVNVKSRPTVQTRATASEHH